MESKKNFLIIIALVISMVASAQNDTTIVKHSEVIFDKEVYTSKSGNTKEYYYAYMDNVCYSTNKETYNRNKAYKRFGIKPTYAIITNKKGKRIIIL